MYYICTYTASVNIHIWDSDAAIHAIASLQVDEVVLDLGSGGGEESWADCVSGTLDPNTFLSMLTKAGFVDVELAGFTGYRTATSTTGALFKAIKPG